MVVPFGILYVIPAHNLKQTAHVHPSIDALIMSHFVWVTQMYNVMFSCFCKGKMRCREREQCGDHQPDGCGFKPWQGALLLLF